MTTPQPVYVVKDPRPGNNGIASAALVCGIVGFAIGLFPFGTLIAWPLALLAIIFGHIGHAKGNKIGVRRKEGIAGWILGYVTLFVLPVLWLIIGGIISSGQ